MALALRIERRFSKDEVLSLSEIHLGNGANGIEGLPSVGSGPLRPPLVR